MEPTLLRIGDVIVHAPVTAGTNLLLAVQCLVYYRRFRDDAGARARHWAAFFAMMSVATLAGVLKHGAGPGLSASGFAVVLWISNVTGGASTWFAQHATIHTHASPAAGVWWGRVVALQLLFFLGANLALGPEMLLLVGDTALGLLPVIVVEGRAAVRGHRKSGWVAGGLCVSIGTAAVYVTGLSAGRWLNHIDIAHVMLGVSFALIARGARDRPGAGGGVR